MPAKEKVKTIIGMVQRVHGGGDDWKATLRSMLKLDKSLDDNLRKMWSRNQEIAMQNKQCLSPEEFARWTVDQNFSSLID